MTVLRGDWLAARQTRAVMAMLTVAGHQAYFVGGCVRDALLERPVADLDIATDAHPARVLALARKSGLRGIATGFDHGTVTVISGDTAHQITTFRKDIKTDGRHAVVSFADNIDDDARRRDFTMNALYANCEGEVFDPLGGMSDLRAGRVRFIGDAGSRIIEDHLRSLRFFR
ncbi:MAG: CCA tRNA nucleotidyltransferase, partial [Paracoccaceae bacterium]